MFSLSFPKLEQPEPISLDYSINDGSCGPNAVRVKASSENICCHNVCSVTAQLVCRFCLTFGAQRCSRSKTMTPRCECGGKCKYLRMLVVDDGANVRNVRMISSTNTEGGVSHTDTRVVARRLFSIICVQSFDCARDFSRAC